MPPGDCWAGSGQLIAFSWCTYGAMPGHMMRDASRRRLVLPRYDLAGCRAAGRAGSIRRLEFSPRVRCLAVGILEVGLAVLVEGADALDSIGMDGRAPVRFHHDRDGLLDRFALAHPDRLLDGLYRGR
jgi:hypothetical protein